MRNRPGGRSVAGASLPRVARPRPATDARGVLVPLRGTLLSRRKQPERAVSALPYFHRPSACSRVKVRSSPCSRAISVEDHLASQQTASVATRRAARGSGPLLTRSARSGVLKSGDGTKNRLSSSEQRTWSRQARVRPGDAIHQATSRGMVGGRPDDPETNSHEHPAPQFERFTSWRRQVRKIPLQLTAHTTHYDKNKKRTTGKICVFK